MAESHFKLKAVIDGQEVVGDRLDNLQGNKTINVFPTSKNNSNTPIKSSASIRLLTKIYNVSLTHKGKDSGDPEPSSYKWSYITPLYSIGDTRVSEETKKDQDTAYVRFSCGKTQTSGGNTYIKTIISKPYNTLAGLEETVGDFSKEHYGREINSTNLIDLVWFKMYYKNIGDDGVVPEDDDTPESNKSRIPCRPDVSAVPNWITEPKLNYHIWVYFDLEHTRGDYFDFDTWEDFINYWDNTVVTSPDIVDASFTYILWAKVQPNNLTSGRSGTITFNEISDGKGSGIHGAEPLYLKLSQQEGFINYHLSSFSVSSNAFVDYGDGSGEYVFDRDITPMDSFINKLPETTDDTYGHYCTYTPEFKIRSSVNAGRGAPAKMWRGNIIEGVTESYLYPLTGEGHLIVYYQYLGKPVIFSFCKETPSIIESSYMKPYGEDSDQVPVYSTAPFIEGSWLRKGINNLLGKSTSEPFKQNYMWHGDYTGLLTQCTLGFSHYSRRVPAGSFTKGALTKHWIFKLVPLLIKTSTKTLTHRGLGVNEVEYFNNGDGAVTADDVLNRGVYSIRYTKLYVEEAGRPGRTRYDFSGDTDPTKNSIATCMGRWWEMLNTSDPDVKNITQVMFLPVLFTDFYLENENPFEDSEDAIGRLYFSPGEVEDSSVDSNLHQLVINRPLITRI